MKIRLGFVSNSSSSSFVVAKVWLSPRQIELIHRHLQEARRMGLYGILENGWEWDQDSDAWQIEELEDRIVGDTSMDNIDMRQYLKAIGVDMSKVAIRANYEKTKKWNQRVKQVMQAT